MINFLLTAPIDYLVSISTRTRTPSQNPFLSGNYAPTLAETLPQKVKVTGTIPDDLKGGTFLRTGPNPAYTPDGHYHWFDGDGKLHAVYFGNDDTIYSSQMIQTDRYKEEKRLESPQYLRIGWMYDGKARFFIRVFWLLIKETLGFIKKLPTLKLGQANTAIEFHDGRLFSLHEASLPFQISVQKGGFLKSIGYFDYDGALKHAMTAHPKIDVDGDMRFIGYGVHEGLPYLNYSVALNDKLLVTKQYYKDTIPKPVMMHDFGITKNYSLILDLPLVLTIFDKDNQMPFTFRKDLPARIGVLDKYGKKEITWFQISNCFVFHLLNCWEDVNEKDEDVIVLVGCRLTSVDLSIVSDVNAPPKDASTVWMWILNLSTGKVTETCLYREKNRSVDFPRCHPRLQGQKTRYGYFTKFDDNFHTPTAVGVVKLDLTGIENSKTINFGNGKFGGEVYYYPKSGASCLEDDGYLMTFIHDDFVDGAEMWLWDAKSMSDVPLARVSIPERIPFGFHCRFVTSEEIDREGAKNNYKKVHN